MADSPAVADGNSVTVSAPPVQSRAVTRTTPSGVPAPAPGAGVPGAPRAAGGAPADVAAPRRSGRLRRFVLPVVALAAIGFAGKFAYDYYVEGRFLVSTDDAYVGANTAIIAAKASGHLMQVPVVDNQVVHQGDLIALIDDGDYRIAVDAAQAKVDTQDATIARFGRQIEAQGAVIEQAAAQVDALAGAIALRGGRRRARRARIRPLVQACPDQFRLPAATRAGHRRSRPHRRDGGRRQGERRFGGRRARGREGQSRCPQG